MNGDSTDVLVIGAGPAGSIAAAKVHKSGLKVRVVEKEKFPRFVIGESLLPRCMDVLEDIDLLDTIKARNFQQKFGAKFLRGKDITDFNFSEQFTNGWTWTWQVPRSEFDLALIQEVERRGVRVDFESTVTNIEFGDDETSVTTILRKDGTTDTIRARFIIDASGYGRVIPRLFKLEKPSTLDPRKAVFAHIRDEHRLEFEEPNRIVVVIYQPGVWVWVIPFSSGVTSLGFVGDFPFFDKLGGDLSHQFKFLIDGNEYLRNRFSDQQWVFQPRKLESWSVTTESFFGKGYVLTGNVTEFLDPVFSSGVMFATVSSHLASNLVIKKLGGQPVDWQNEYTRPIQQGVETFRSYVIGWYDGTLEKIFFNKKPNLEIKRQICSVLAGYVWDESNPFGRDHAGQLNRVSKFISFEERIAQ